MIKRILIAAFFGSFGVCTACAQSMPLVARFRSTGEITINGKVTETHVREGFFYRASNGSEVRRPTTFDGKRLQGPMGRASLFDKIHGTNYVIDYEKKQATQESQPSFLGLVPATPPATTSAPSGKSSVEGFVCTLHPVYSVKPAGTTLIGTNCVSEQYDLILKTDVTRPSDLVPGKAAHEITELYDIQMGVEPDPKLFDLGSLKVIPEKP